MEALIQEKKTKDSMMLSHSLQAYVLSNVETGWNFLDFRMHY